MEKRGRPLKFETPEQMQAEIDRYFETCKPSQMIDRNGDLIFNKDGEPIMETNPPTVAGLALFLGFVNRQSMYDYGNRVEFSDTIKKAVARIESFAEKQLYNSKPTGAIFWLKNHGWTDKSEITQTTTIKKALVEFVDEKPKKKQEEKSE